MFTKPKVGLVSTYPPTKDGIARYSLALVDAMNKLNKVDIIIFSNRKGIRKCYSNIHVIKAWKRGSFSYVFSLPYNIVKKRVHIVHFQHEYVLYGEPIYSGLFPIVLALCRILRKKVVVTMHSVLIKVLLNSDFFQDYGAGKKLVTFKKALTILLTKLIGFFSHKIIVHSDMAKKELIQSYKIPCSKISVIPHGVFSISHDVVPSEKAKEIIGLKGRIILCFGLLRPGRGIEYAIKALKMIIKEFPDTKLVIAGKPHSFSVFNASNYLNRLKRIVKELDLDNNVIFFDRYIPDKELHLLLCAADIIILPYIEKGIISTSGALLTAMPYLKPLIVTKTYRFSDLWNIKTIPLVKPKSPEELKKAITNFFSRPSIKEKMNQELYGFMKKRQWITIANKTLAIYKDLLRRGVKNEKN